MNLMQLRLRQNNDELQDYLRDLESWEEEIKSKDRDLSERRSILKDVGAFRTLTVTALVHYFDCFKLTSFRYHTYKIYDTNFDFFIALAQL